jgi:hypothetical protein
LSRTKIYSDAFSRNFKVRLIRVSYGAKNVPVENREYQIDGRGPVGTLAEFKKMLPREEFEIVER